MVAATVQGADIRTDEDIQRDLLAELKFEPRVRPNEIGVMVKNGVVTLTGWVDSYSKRWAAEHAAHRVHGVKAVANDIEVRLPNAAERTDTDIAVAVLHALEWDALIPTDDLKVTVSKGSVTLRGTVEWNFQKLDAERIVRRIAGVKGVANLLTVRPRDVPPDPEELKKKIEEALVRSVETDARKISVEIQGTKVILRGTVRSWAEREDAERAAWSAPGITMVENTITVSY